MDDDLGWEGVEGKVAEHRTVEVLWSNRPFSGPPSAPALFDEGVLAGG